MGLFTDPVFKKRESWGYLLALLIRGCGWTTWVFTGVAVLKLANNSVGCSTKGFEITFNSTMNRTQTEEEADMWEVACTGEIDFFGKAMTPATSIPFTTAIGLVISTLVSPIFGAIIDRTTRRKAVTFLSLGVYVAINAFQALISEDTYMLILFLQNILNRIAFALHVSCVAAYCTEIAEGETEIIALQSAGRVAETGSMVVTLFSIIIGSAVAGVGDDVVKTAAFGQVLATVVSLPLMLVCWTMFEERAALNKTTGNIVTSGFGQLGKTTKLLWTENRQVLQYLIGLSFHDAANGNVFVLFPIYAMLQVKLANPALFTGIAMIMCIPGALLTKKIGTKIGLRKQLGNIQVANAVITIALIALFHKEGALLGVLLVATGYGLTIGGTYPMQKGLFMRLIPAGQEVEYQGLYNFFGQLLGSLPSMWFVYCEDEEIGGAANSMRVGMLALIVFYFVAFFLMSLFLDEKSAVEKAQGTMHKRLRPQFMLTNGRTVGVDKGGV